MGRSLAQAPRRMLVRANQRVFHPASDSGAVGLSCSPTASEAGDTRRDLARVARPETELAQSSTFRRFMAYMEACEFRLLNQRSP
jgi:hypothetical protein